MKNLAASIVVVLLSVSTVIAGDASKRVCDAKGCRIVEAPQKVLREGKEVVQKVIESPVKLTHSVKRSKPVRSFLLRVFR